MEIYQVPISFLIYVVKRIIFHFRRHSLFYRIKSWIVPPLMRVLHPREHWPRYEDPVEHLEWMRGKFGAVVDLENLTAVVSNKDIYLTDTFWLHPDTMTVIQECRLRTDYDIVAIEINGSAHITGNLICVTSNLDNSMWAERGGGWPELWSDILRFSLEKFLRIYRQLCS